jgi:hypothetical protein
VVPKRKVSSIASNGRFIRSMDNKNVLRSMEVILTAIITWAGENVLKVELKLQIVSFGKVG